jgi:hypothetical protein
MLTSIPQRLAKCSRSRDKWGTYTPGFLSTMFEFGDKIELSVFSMFDVVEVELSFKDKAKKSFLGLDGWTMMKPSH